MEDLLLNTMEHKMEQMGHSLMSKMQENLEATRSLLIDQLKQINEKIDSQKGVKAEQDLGESDSDLDPFIMYEERSVLGGGVSGEVLLVRDRDDKYFAMKRIFMEGNSLRPELAREISFLYDLEHDNIIKLKNVYLYRRHLYLLMEDAGMNLFDFLRSEKVSAEAIKFLLRQLLSALAYLHEREIIHRDLKPENICIGDNLRLRICDFGSVRKFADLTVLTPYATTVIFMAPEMLMGATKYGEKVDMWSAGCIFYEMAEGKNLFSIQHIQHQHSSVLSVLHEVFRKIGKPKEGSELFSLGGYLTYEQEYPGHREASDVVPVPVHVPSLDADGNDLLKKLLAVDPSDRIAAREALNHPYFKVGSVTYDAAEMRTTKRKRSKFS